MIGMSFASFVALLILGLIAAIVMHSLIRYRVVGTFDGFVAKWIAGWIGAWLGTPVLGHWWLRYDDVYLIPALVGAFVTIFSVTFLFKAAAVTRASVSRAMPAAAPPELLKKVS